MLIITKWFILSVAIYVASFLVSGFYVHSLYTLIAASALLGFLNIYIKPFVILLTLPFNILTFGLFTILINASLLYFVSIIFPNMYFNSFFSAILSSIIISIISILINMILQE